MAFSINGSTGISGLDGSAATPAIKGTDADSGVFFGTDTASIATAGTERLFVAADGNIGVGHNSPITLMHLQAADATLRIESTDPQPQEARLQFRALDAGGTARNMGQVAGVGHPSVANAGDLVLHSRHGGGLNETMRLNHESRVYIGAASDDVRTYAPFGSTAEQPKLHVAGSSFDTAMSVFRRSQSGSNAPYLILAKDGGSFADGVSNNDDLGSLVFMGSDGYGSDGTDQEYKPGAYIRGIVDGDWSGAAATTPGEDCPGRLEFAVTPEDSRTPVTAMTIKNNGSVLVGTGVSRSSTLHVGLNRGSDVLQNYMCVADGLILKYINDSGLTATQRKRFTFTCGSRDSAIITIEAVCRRSTSNTSSQFEGACYKAMVFASSSGNVVILSPTLIWTRGMAESHFIFTNNGAFEFTIDVDNSVNNSGTTWSYDITIQNSVANQVRGLSTEIINE